MTKVIGKTGVPTGTHTHNPWVGCLRCDKERKCAGGGFTCWAGGFMQRYWFQWLKYEIRWCIDNKPVEVDLLDTLEKLEGFKPVRLQFQVDKQFPKKPAVIQVGWMTDITFLPAEWIEEEIDKIRKDNAERFEKGLEPHKFLFLTKGSAVIYQKHAFPGNCYLGVTINKNRDILERFKGFATPLNPMFLYIEPMMEEVDITPVLPYIVWVIAGGKNGPGTKPTDLRKFRKVRDVCVRNNIPFFFKSPGGNVHTHVLDGVEWKQTPWLKQKEEL